MVVDWAEHWAARPKPVTYPVPLQVHVGNLGYRAPSPAQPQVDACAEEKQNEQDQEGSLQPGKASLLSYRSGGESGWLDLVTETEVRQDCSGYQVDCDVETTDRNQS